MLGKVVLLQQIGVRVPLSFRWETRDDALVSIDTDGNTANPLTQTHGTISGGSFSRSRFTMNQCVSLRHDLPWRVEWKSSGTWTDTTDGALLFSQYNSSSTANGCYLYRSSNNDFFALGTYSGGKYHNYGVSFANSGIDTTQEHIFRLENRISDDGSNMVYLFVDDAQVGPLNHYWVGGTDQKKADDWVSGKDFTFSYLGTNPHTIGGCTLDYIQVWEDYHTHTYENGICTGCGAVQADIVIVTQPVPYDAAIGEKATLRVEAMGENLRYQWYYRDAGSLEFTKSTVRKSTYTLTVKPINVDRELYCVITDAKGNQVTTDTVKLLQPLAQELKILRQPQPAFAAMGEVATVSMEVQGEGLRYQWYYRDLPNGSLTKSTITTADYSLTVKPTNVNRELYCVITDAHGNQVTTDTVKLLQPLSQELKILRQPQPAFAAMGEVATVSVEAQGDGLRYQWYYRDLPDGSLTRSSITASAYSVTVTAFNARRVLYCVITDCCGNKVTTDTVPMCIDRTRPSYYATLADALSDTNASSSPEGAVAEVIRESGSTTVTLLQDTTLTEPVMLSAAVTLELGGYSVSSAIFPMIRVEAEGCTIQNGSMKLSHEGTAAGEVIAISVAPGAALELSGCTVTVTDSGNSTVVGILTEGGSTLMATQTDITVTTGTSLSNAGIRARGKVILRDCTVIAEADYTGANGAYTSNSAGIYAYAGLELYDCYVWGTHSGVSAKGKVYVNGGTYEGYGHGGFYLSASGETSYFCNAAFNWAAMRPGTVADSVAGTNNSAFYIGSSSNITAYFDNCSFKGNKSGSKSYGLVLRSSGGESNNIVYVSNSTFTGYQRYAYRIGNAESTKNLLVYSGVGNSYGTRVFNYIAKGIYTEDSYAQIIADNTPIS